MANTSVCAVEALTLVIATMTLILVGTANIVDDDGWDTAHATFYGDMHGNETMQGACGYGNMFEQGYGLQTTALSEVLFNHGLTCGACYQIRCYESPWCLQGHPVIRVTSTNLCPPNYTKPIGPMDDHWCNPPHKHFDLSQPMFRTIAEYKAGIVPVYYRRVTCVKKGGIKFEIKGNPYWISVTVFNVGGVGDVKEMKVKGSNTGWMSMTRSWGQVWVTKDLVGQSMSFQVITSDGKMIQSDNVAPPDWKFGQVYEGKQFP